jgi:hypothetical protein
MTITISNLTISNNVPAGTTIGVLTAQDASGTIIPCDYRLTKGSLGYFAIAGNLLVTTWSTPATAGYYPARIRAIGSNGMFRESATFIVNIVPAGPPPPPPPPPRPPPPPPVASITVNGSTNAVVSEGAALTVNVSNGPGNTADWVGLAVAGTPDTTFISWDYLSGTQTPPATGMTSATITMTAPTNDGPYEARFYPDNAFTVSARTGFSVTPPPAASITVNGTANAAVTEGAALTVNVTNGPGNTTDWVGLAVAGTPDTAFISWDYLSGTQTPPATGMTSATITTTAPTSDGPYEARFYPNNASTVSARTGFSVTPPAAPQPVITITPTTPEVPDMTPLGAVVATYAVAMSDGSPFSGTVRFAAPFFDAGGIFALSGNNIIVNPNGPGIGPNITTMTDRITLETVQ